MAEPIPAVVDFETKPIERRPVYPPEPVGVSIRLPGRQGKYYAWGHETGNNCSKEDAARALKALWREKTPILCHFEKFDLDIAETSFGLKMPPWERRHDTMYLAFLNDPHALSLELKPLAEKELKMKPKERDKLKKWILEHVPEARGKGKKWGEHIWRAPGHMVADYANGDTERPLKLFQKLYPKIVKEGMKEAYDRERRIMPILLDNEREGMRVALRKLIKHAKDYERERARAEAWLRKRLGVRDLNFDSDEDVADALARKRIVTEWKYTEPTKSHPEGQRSVSKKNLTLDMFRDKRVAAALGYRNRLTTCLGTFFYPWIEQAEQGDGRIMTTWNQVRQNDDTGRSFGTRTGRPSTKRPNFLNVPKQWYDKDDGYEHPSFLRGLRELPLMREYILPDEGQLWLHRDYNQQELRIAAHYENSKLMRAYKESPRMDVHDWVSDQIEAVRHVRLGRRPVKITNFLMIYGGGLKALMERLRIDNKEARRIKSAHKDALPGLYDLLSDIQDDAQDGEPIRTWGGRLYYAEEPKLIRGRWMEFHYKLMNYLVQGSAADATKEALLRYHEAKKHSRFLVTVYDEINISAPKKAWKKEMQILKDAMESVEFDVPMLTDGKVGPTWARVKKLQEG